MKDYTVLSACNMGNPYLTSKKCNNLAVSQSCRGDREQGGDVTRSRV